MQRRHFLPTLAASCLHAAPTRKPNLLFILADDLGIANLSCYGADNYKTPNLDRLAASGTRFTNAYTAPLCGPSRSLILTGRYAFRTGATNQDATGRMSPAKETFMPRILKPAGYVSTCIGKWGQLPLGPAEFGFDEHLTFQGSGAYWNTQPKARRYTVNGQTRKLEDKQYLPDVMHDAMAAFLTRNQNNPFYAYYSLSHVHAEILPTPDSAPDSKDLYADNIAYMDKLVGKLITHLDQLKLRDNTLILFVGDNGTGGAHAAKSTIRGRRLSGAKGDMQEAGSLVPLIANWPGHTPAGKVSSQLIDSTDFVPTFAELAATPLPKDTPIDGHSFAATLEGKPAKPRDWVYLQLANNFYVRDSKFKLNQSGELYDMSQAPFAETLIPAPQQPTPRTRLQSVLNQLNPTAGITDQGDGTGRHANRQANRKPKSPQ